MLEALFFDFDGTIADTERDGHRVAYNRAFKDAGLDWHWSEPLYGELLAVTGGKERMRYFIKNYAAKLGMEMISDEQIEPLYRSKSGIFKQVVSEGGIGLRPGILRILQEARDQGIRLAVVTTTFEGNVRSILDKYLPGGVDEWIELIAAGDIVEHKKPAPDIYLLTMERMGLAPDQCVAFEDSRNGLLSAIQAGISRVIITYNGYTEEEDFSEATLVVDQLGEKNHPTRVKLGTIGGSELVDMAVLRSI